MKSLPAGTQPRATATERRELLRAYILSCLKDNVLTIPDLVNPAVVLDRLHGAAAADLRGVVLGRGTARVAQLRAYLDACGTAGAVSLADLLSPLAAVRRILAVLKGDLTSVLTEMGKTGSANALRMVGDKFARLADSIGEDPQR